MTTTADDWRQGAACREVDPELFFPAGTTGHWEAQANEAKAVCWQCPVVESCLAWALENGIEHGVAGGTTEQERAALKRRTRRQAARTTAYLPKRTRRPSPARCGTPEGRARHKRHKTAMCNACRNVKEAA